MINTADIKFINADRKIFFLIIESEVIQRYKTQMADTNFEKARD
jgi:hypothetical protein